MEELIASWLDARLFDDATKLRFIECPTDAAHEADRVRGLRIPLGLDRPRIDFHREIKSGEDARLLSVYLSGAGKMSSAIEPVRHRLLDFCERWSDPASPLFGRIADIILEFDMIKSADLLPPAIFLATRPDDSSLKLSEQESYAAMTSAWGILTGNPPSRAMSDTLRRCLVHPMPRSLILV